MIDDIPLVVENGALDGGLYLKAVSFLRDEGFWKSWAIRALLALSVGHILSAIIFFFAFNWNDLSPMSKFAVVGGGIATCLLAWILARLDSPARQAFGIGATVLVGVMFAVLGQVYQTPAMIHTPFVFWAILTLPFALASRNLAHWAVWLVILTVAVSSYANSGLRLAGDDMFANLLNIVVAGGMIAGLVVLDIVLSPRLKWARGEWFRVLLVLGAIGFAFFGFTESYWDNGNGFWVLALGVMGALLAYLYWVKPSLATLSLACFGVFLMVAQFGFKLFDGLGWEIGTIFLIFFWLGGLTVVLVALFRHFIMRLNSGGEEFEAARKEKGRDPTVTPLSSFASHLGVESGGIKAALSSDVEREQPWYMSVFLAIAGILTALIGCLFFGFLIALTAAFEDELSYGILGLIIFAGAIFIRRTASSPYAQHIVNTMILVGGIMAVLGIGIKFGDFDVAVGTTFVLAAIVLVLVKDSILEFLTAGALIATFGMELYHLHVPLVESLILIVSTVLGVVLISRPLGRRLYKSAGTAFLVAPALLGIALVHSQRWQEAADPSRFSDGWLALVISIVVLLGGVMFLNRGKPLSELKPPLMVLIPLVIGAACVHLGGASALLLILTGYILGSRTLAIIGTLLQIYFLTMFYYDLSLDLLTKSIILLVPGVLFLGVWLFVRRKEEGTA